MSFFFNLKRYEVVGLEWNILELHAWTWSTLNSMPFGPKKKLYLFVLQTQILAHGNFKRITDFILQNLHPRKIRWVQIEISRGMFFFTTTKKSTTSHIYPCNTVQASTKHDSNWNQRFNASYITRIYRFPSAVKLEELLVTWRHWLTKTQQKPWTEVLPWRK